MNKPTNPIAGDAWADENTLEIKIWDGREWIVLPEPPTSPLDKLQFGDKDTGFATKDDELTLIPGGVETFRIKPDNRIEPDKMCINNNNTTLVSIDTKTGDIEYGDHYNPDETARVFWEALGNFPQREEASQNVLQELRGILGVKENESICSVARHLVDQEHDELHVVTVGNDDTGEIGISIKVGDHVYPDYMLSEDRMLSFYDLLKQRYETHDEDCNWHTWDHIFSWSESDCTCVKDDCMKDEPWFVPASVEMMDFTTPFNVGRGKGSKVEVLPSGSEDDIRYFEEKVSVSKDGKMSWRALTKEEIAFNEAMKVIE